MNYEEKLNLAKEALESGSYDKETIEYIFPELRESEGEKIRKSILTGLIDCRDAPDLWWSDFGGIPIDDCIAWLEKQGEQNPYSGVSFKYNGHTWGMCARDNGVEILFDGELKAFLSSEKSFIYPIHPQPDLTPKNAMEAIKEEKVDNANKVEQNFKVGDWVVDNCGYTWKIGGILNQFYILEGVEGGESRPTIEWVDETCHLWTLKDAKDGDVLVDEHNNIGLYRGEKDDFWESYIYLGCNNYLYGPNIGGYHEHKNTKPATKEQRDLLFKKMKEAGYKWDTEKKELRVIDWSKHIKYDPNNPSITKENPACGENDEIFVHGLIRGLSAKRDIHGHTTFGSDYLGITEAIDWLRTLKDRLHPQWKPSEEQIDVLNMVVTDEAMDDNVKTILKELLIQIKKL